MLAATAMQQTRLQSQRQAIETLRAADRAWSDAMLPYALEIIREAAEDGGQAISLGSAGTMSRAAALAERLQLEGMSCSIGQDCELYVRWAR